MVSLSSLERENPILDSNFRHFCGTHGFFTVEDFLVHDLYVLAALAEKQPRSERLKEGIAQVICCIHGYHQPWMDGLKLLQDAQEKKYMLQTGFERVDLLLKGGFRVGQLNELAGPSSSGKTQVCFKFASIVARKYRGGVFYIDTSNSFSPQRIKHLVCQLANDKLDQAKNINVQPILSSIFCHSVFDINDLLDVLQQLEIMLHHQLDSRALRLHSVIIDSLSSLVTPILGGSSHGHALMASAGAVLKRLAHEHNLVVLVTNHMVGGEGGNMKPALGETWKSLPHTRLLLSRNHDSNLCSISILKHPSLASGISASFAIDS